MTNLGMSCLVDNLGWAFPFGGLKRACRVPFRYTHSPGLKLVWQLWGISIVLYSSEGTIKTKKILRCNIVSLCKVNHYAHHKRQTITTDITGPESASPCGHKRWFYEFIMGKLVVDTVIMRQPFCLFFLPCKSKLSNHGLKGTMSVLFMYRKKQYWPLLLTEKDTAL